jgi:hypothetical protein
MRAEGSEGKETSNAGSENGIEAQAPWGELVEVRIVVVVKAGGLGSHA